MTCTAITRPVLRDDSADFNGLRFLDSLSSNTIIWAGGDRTRKIGNPVGIFAITVERKRSNNFVANEMIILLYLRR